MREKDMEQIQQKVYLSRKSLNSIEFEHEVLRIPLKAGEETSFEILVTNHGDPTHVHFSLSREMRDKLMIMQDKVYVIDDEKIASIVRLPKSYAGAMDKFSIGEISVSTGYGATKRSFSVEIVESKERGAETERYRDELEFEAALPGKGKKEVKLSADERVFLSRLSVSAFAAISFFILVVLIVHIGVFGDSPGYLFVSALIASLLFIFVVIYNL